ncbi:hypothetical protein HOP51_08555 [Halomonas sp. MCCC 1A11036]|uniref:Uncharacterized protein n=1 Tax=Billgrantia zhangzhouensis TaxID=2733481 RepID=A0ABS9AEM2_9GAMM|nr:hypothetical protein [Halomonas zhangzhouensis]MCE8020164.1 hypothetical protein [Halomonas zhangzhouensis]
MNDRLRLREFTQELLRKIAAGTDGLPSEDRACAILEIILWDNETPPDTYKYAEYLLQLFEKLTKATGSAREEVLYEIGVATGVLISRIGYGYSVDEVAEMSLKTETGSKNLISKQKQRGYEALRREARSLALDKWARGQSEGPRVGEMASWVHEVLCDKYRRGHPYFDCVPALSKKVAEWIRPIAPDYAKKPGRSRK